MAKQTRVKRQPPTISAKINTRQGQDLGNQHGIIRMVSSHSHFVPKLMTRVYVCVALSG